MRFLLPLLLVITTSAQVTHLERDPATKPKIVNAKLEESALKGDVPGAIAAASKGVSESFWMGYSVAAIPGRRFICCFDHSTRDWERRGCCSGCTLDHEGGVFTNNSDRGTCVNQVETDHVVVLFRVENARVTKLRPVTPDCGIDADGKRLVWLGAVDSGQSVPFLRGLIESTFKNDESDHKVSDQALMALALHSGKLADDALSAYIAPDKPRKMRQNAAFWLAEEHGHNGFLAIQHYIREDKDDRFRQELAFPLSESKDPEALDELIRVAHKDLSPDVRGQALFWLAQKAGKKAAGEVSEAAENDSDSGVRKKAIFALSQMPPDQGVPLLIKYAKSHKDPQVRKEAIFWLGESKDPRALDFLEELLLGNKKQ